MTMSEHFVSQRLDENFVMWWPRHGGLPVRGDVEYVGILDGLLGMTLGSPHTHTKRARGSCLHVECWCLHVHPRPGKTRMAKLFQNFLCDFVHVPTHYKMGRHLCSHKNHSQICSMIPQNHHPHVGSNRPTSRPRFCGPMSLFCSSSSHGTRIIVGRRVFANVVEPMSWWAAKAKTLCLGGSRRAAVPPRTAALYQRCPITLRGGPPCDTK